MPEKGVQPEDIPKAPFVVYKSSGWINWGDWLGTGTIAPKLREYRPFNEAREFVRSLGLTSSAEWRKLCKGELLGKGSLPEDIPAAPDRIYKEQGWLGFGDWLGTGRIADQNKRNRPFKEARAFTRKLELKNEGEWRRYCKGEMPGKGKKPDDITASPGKTYKSRGWNGMGDWLGTGTVAFQLREYRPFNEARGFARSLRLTSNTEWRKFCKGELPEKGRLPEDIPAIPDRVYKEQGWKGYGDWTGTGITATRFREYRPFNEAREFARSLRFTSNAEWRKFCKGELKEKGSLPEDIPSHPNKVYKDKGWKGAGDWLGTFTIAPSKRIFRSFKEARKFARNLGLKNGAEWKKYCQGRMPGKDNLPEDIPTNPNRTYKDQGWNGMGDWLGTGTVAFQLREYRPFNEAREFARSLRLTSNTEWRKFCKGELPEKGRLPEDIPAKPDNTYKNRGWKGMTDWLGTDKKGK